MLETKEIKSVQLLGRIDDLESYFSKISLLLHPSTNESTLPMSVIETLGSGREAIVFDLPAFSEFEGLGLIKIKKDDWKGLL
jgi:glycosyltransferase involved in cell wall biosynthesis